jgi:hypothetical protein
MIISVSKFLQWKEANDNGSALKDKRENVLAHSYQIAKENRIISPFTAYTDPEIPPQKKRVS